MKIQLIGLPCSGKTTAIKKYLSMNSNISYIDYAQFSTENQCIKKVKSTKGKVLVESACGLSHFKSIVILYKQPIDRIYSRHKRRGEELDEDYLSLLQTAMLKPQYTVTTNKALFSTLNLLFY